MKKLIAFVLSLVGAYLMANPIGRWFDSQYAGGGFLYWGPFPGYLDGLLFGYIFFASILFPVFTSKIKAGFYVVSPILALHIILGAFDPQLWIDLVLLAIGLGLAWLIMFIRNQVRTTKSN